jgi:integrase
MQLEDLDNKIDRITQYASKAYFNKALKRLARKHPENANVICDYIIAEQTEINIKPSTTEGKIKILIWLSNFHSGRSFSEMTKADILGYLGALRKSIEEDPFQRWIGSYNGRQTILTKFFRWLYNPDESDQRKRITPPCMQGTKKLGRKEKTRYKHNDMWDAREHAVFLKYCPDKRDRCYHAMAIDTSARPHELLSLQISDLKFNITEEGKQYGELVIKQGKTGGRTVPLIDSIPYIKAWITDHPSGTNPNSWLFISKANNSFAQKLTYDGIVDRYSYLYKTRFFPKLLEDNTVPESDKSFIRSMLTKPWTLYVFRHYSLSDKAQILSDSALKDHAGWSMSSNMPQVYVHLRGESSKILLRNKGIIKREDNEINEALRCTQCPNCLEVCIPGVRFCSRCQMILSYNGYKEIVESKKEKQDRLSSIEKQLQTLLSAIGSIGESGKSELAQKLVQNGAYKS